MNLEVQNSDKSFWTACISTIVIGILLLSISLYARANPMDQPIQTQVNIEQTIGDSHE